MAHAPEGRTQGFEGRVYRQFPAPQQLSVLPTAVSGANFKLELRNTMNHELIGLAGVQDDFEQPTHPPNGAAAKAEVKAAHPKPLFSGVSAKSAAKAKKGNLSSSRTGQAKQATFNFGKPRKGVFTKVHPSPDYSMTNVPMYQNEITGTFHFITPDLFESGELPDRFLRAVKTVDIFTAGAADGSFFLWWVPVSSSQWRKGALKAVEAAKQRYCIVEAFEQAQTYSIEMAAEPIPDPAWGKLPAFEQMLLDAFDSTISVPDDKVVRDYMSGGVANRQDEDEE